MKIQLWFRVTSFLVFLQIALGGLLTFSFITAFPAHRYWVRGPRLRNSYTGDGSNVEAAVQTTPGPLHRIGFADRIPDYSRIRYSSN